MWVGGGGVCVCVCVCRCVCVCVCGGWFGGGTVLWTVGPALSMCSFLLLHTSNFSDSLPLNTVKVQGSRCIQEVFFSFDIF